MPSPRLGDPAKKASRLAWVSGKIMIEKATTNPGTRKRSMASSRLCSVTRTSANTIASGKAGNAKVRFEATEPARNKAAHSKRRGDSS